MYHKQQNLAVWQKPFIICCGVWKLLQFARTTAKHNLCGKLWVLQKLSCFSGNL